MSKSKRLRMPSNRKQVRDEAIRRQEKRNLFLAADESQRKSEQQPSDAPVTNPKRSQDILDAQYAEKKRQQAESQRRKNGL